MKPQYRALRPAQSSASHDDLPHSSPSGLTRKREKVKLACNVCRTKKSACDGQRPTCGSCLKRGSICTFADAAKLSPAPSPAMSQTSEKSSAELLSILQTAPDDDARELLARLRAGEPVFSILASWREGNEGARPVKPTAAEDMSNILVLAPDQASLEYELMIRYPVSYPPPTSLESSLYTSPPVQGPNPPLAPRSYSDESSMVLRDGTTETNELRMTSRSPSEPIPVQPSTFSAGGLWTVRLAQAHIAYWTDMPITKDDAVRVITLYLDIDHPILGLFDADLFINDLLGTQQRFCSGLLVEALLSWAYLAHGPDQPQHGTITDTLITVALSRWENGPVPDSLPNIQALQLLSLTTNFLGQGNISKELLRQSILMGTRMNLLISGEDSQLHTSFYQEDECRAASQTAWGLFSHATFHSLHCQQLELGSLNPPKLPIPEQASNVAPVFPYTCQLWLIVHDILCQRFTESKRPLSASNDVHFIESTLLRLLKFGEELPTQLCRGGRIPHCGIILHIHYHATIAFLLRPLLLQGNDARISLPRISGSEPAHAHFHGASPTVFWHIAFLYVANSACRAQKEDLQRWQLFYMAIDGYALLSARFPMIIAIVKGLMMIAIVTNLITNEEAFKLVDRFRGKEATTYRFIANPTKTCLIVDLDLAITDNQAAHIDVLAQRFDEMALFDELIADKGLD
ncbi:hypothetical protein B0I35DRAFT_73701 [Stachybotrys elegans]|uniref:Zn(2)-C6 fungal-type domain-containing protein n=1 Tax=Stachybotrys elegans TaxID=80388 RepID=A0A8K0SJZ7_9HYPO|nr:hypothetical protein B0I35DRAFT_73701 [Stachybotrys elegans]